MPWTVARFGSHDANRYAEIPLLFHHFFADSHYGLRRVIMTGQRL